MSRCLYCGNELNSSSAHFCRGHHIPYRRDLIERFNRGEDVARQLRRFPGWWDYSNNCPTAFGGRTASRSERPIQITSTPVQSRVPVEYHFRKFGVELETVTSNRDTVNEAIELARAYGIRIEETGYVHDVRAAWKAASDGSLSGGYGREFVSPVIDSEEKAQEVTQLVNILTMMGVKTNNSCGFHCHLDVSDLTPKQIARVFKFYQVYESEIDRMHQGSRRTDARWCGTLQNYTIDENRLTTMDEITSTFSTRYLKVNIQAYLRQGTIEFRQHGATLDAVKIMNWVKFCTRIIDFAKTENPIDASIPMEEALNLTRAEKLYWAHRRTVLAS